jgi:hypothetical protein
MLGRLRQEEHEFEGSLGYIERSCLKIKETNPKQVFRLLRKIGLLQTVQYLCTFITKALTKTTISNLNAYPLKT